MLPFFLSVTLESNLKRARTVAIIKMCNRSRAEGDKRRVPENYRERQEGQNCLGNDQEETSREYLYSFQPFKRPTFRQVEHQKHP
jgi:hypothetical protein